MNKSLWFNLGGVNIFLFILVKEEGWFKELGKVVEAKVWNLFKLRLLSILLLLCLLNGSYSNGGYGSNPLKLFNEELLNKPIFGGIIFSFISLTLFSHKSDILLSVIIFFFY